ncbi:MAG: hypothetical protein IH796_05045 [Deltaproteobacteria bacterium]|nr:hypothetical protein [Deltaproteobacteria bacterium]
MSQGKLVFEKFIQDLRTVWSELPDVEPRMKRAAQLLEGLVNDPALREHSKAWPSTQGPPAKNLLFYEDPDYGFAINGVVRTPGRVGGVHDHGESWTAYGLLDGTEKLEHYRRLDDTKMEGYAEVVLDYVDEGTPGKVDLVPPFVIHAESGGPRRSVAVIIRSLPIGRRGFSLRFDPEKRTCSHGNGPVQVPFEIS